MMHKVGPVLPVDKLARLLHILGHPWRTTAEDSNLANLSMERCVCPGASNGPLPREVSFSSLTTESRLLPWTLGKWLELGVVMINLPSGWEFSAQD